MIKRVDWQSLAVVAYNGTIMPYRTVVKDLGLQVDQTLSWSLHLKEVSKKIFGAMGSLRRLQSFLPIPTKIMLAHSLLLSILDYADASYLNLTEDQLNKLERLQNLAIRFIFGLRKYDHISEFRHQLKWLPIRRRRNMHVLSLLYCVLFYPNTPSYLKEKFQYLGSHTKSLRSSENLTLKIPVHKTKFYEHSFVVQATKLWNELPLEIQKSKSLNTFKKAVKDFYLTHRY